MADTGLGSELAELDSAIGPLVNWLPHCSAPRRMGPACELYCREPSTGEWLRYDLRSGGPGVSVPCSGLGEDVRIVDVWQR